MKTFVKHIFCLSVITSIVMIAACTKERNKTGQVSDFRDSLVGGYSCDRYTWSRASRFYGFCVLD